jgi:glycosyltransferase involved in cell wall biosynthesis
MPPPTHRPRLIWLAEVPWEGLTQRHHYLVRALREDWDVLFVEPPHALRAPSPRLQHVDGLHVAQVMPVINAHPGVVQRPMRHRWARQIGMRLATAQVQAHLRRLGWTGPHGDGPRGELVVVCSNAYLAHALRSTRGRLKLVDLSDDPRHMPDAPPWADDALRDLVAAADVVTSPSRALLDELRSAAGPRSVYVPNGVSTRVLEAGAARSRAMSMPPRAGYLGFIGAWFDFELVARAAEALPQVVFELVGPVAASEAGQLAALLRRANVRYLDAVGEAQVPNILARFSVGLIPFRLTPLTRAVNPNKLYEYAAFDLPIVATPFSPEVLEWSSAVNVCGSPDAFIAAVREGASVASGGTRAIAEARSWSAIAAQFASLLDLSPRPPAGDDPSRVPR